MKDLLLSPRTPHLLRIWADLCQLKELPQLDRWLVLRMKQDKRFGSRDRRWYSDSIFSVIRWAMPCLERGNMGRHVEPVESWEQLRRIPAETLFAEVAALSEAPPGSGLGSAGLSSWFEKPLARRIELSGWDDAQTSLFLNHQNRRGALWLRLNKAENKAKVEAKLAELGLPFSWHGLALRIDGDKNLSQTPILDEGWAEVQDYGSQLLGESIPIEGASQIWDCCAGGGGKSLQLAALHPKAHVFASDIRSYKSVEVSKRAHRARLPNVTPIPWSGSAHLERPRAAARGFDVILVDAPCSGSGTWRRSPDGRYPRFGPTYRRSSGSPDIHCRKGRTFSEAWRISDLRNVQLAARRKRRPRSARDSKAAFSA